MKNEKTEIEKGLSILAKSSAIVFIGIAISKILSYAYRIIIARYYGPEVYGIFSIAFMVLSLIAFFSLFGFSEGIVRNMAVLRAKKQFNKVKFLVRKIFFILLVSSFLSGFLLYLFAELISLKIFHDASLIIFLKFFSFVIPLWIFSNFFLSIIKAFEKIKAYSFIFNIVQSIVKVLALITLIYLGFNENSIPLSIILAFVIILVISYVYCKKYLAGFIFGRHVLSKNKGKIVFGQFYSYSWPLLLSGLIGGMFYWIDVASLGYFMDSKAVGLYSSAMPLALLLLVIPEIFVHLFLPLISKILFQNKISLVKELSKQINKWIIILNLPALLFLALFPGSIIHLFFGIEYIAAENALRILALGYFFASLSIIPENIILAYGKSKVILINWIIFSIFNLVLNLLLIPVYGLSGAAIATTLSWIFLTLILNFESWVITNFALFRKKSILVVIISIFCTPVIYYLKDATSSNILNILIAGMSYLLAYLFFILLLKGFDRNDMMILRKIYNKIF